MRKKQTINPVYIILGAVVVLLGVFEYYWNLLSARVPSWLGLSSALGLGKKYKFDWIGSGWGPNNKLGGFHMVDPGIKEGWPNISKGDKIDLYNKSGDKVISGLKVLIPRNGAMVIPNATFDKMTGALGGNNGGYFKIK
jgi:hypothetical protein